jgi:hypothetical protein
MGVLAALLVAASLVPFLAAVGAVSCPSDPDSDCGSDCLDCLCCPHPSPVAMNRPAASAVVLRFENTVTDRAESVSDPDPRRILHVPKTVLL